MALHTIPIPSILKKQNGIIGFDLKLVSSLPNFKVQETILLCIPPQQWGGNHRHPRVEAFIAFSEGLQIHWIDKRGDKQIEALSFQTNSLCYIIDSMTPHVIINTTSKTAVLLELANASQYEVEPYPVFIPPSLN